ncbi:TPR repeat-containing protein [Venenivibrio stagnispumantis]|uniref:TPR repeat-containing protein n=1 Tax=Venenivibrio stagnispumantis TaxID=407998 RepID=A0AA45WIN4_9AQUI|nr:tetratricopeptide repeat protein [Venenivibrio stagnispumantis]MCW4572637.1 tetratricopeptide repeat protein [Venenivibrio stagnispumantis]SMP00712.1 TPR repeat-containing protein [Venenivibrio stagnispumantis]
MDTKKLIFSTMLAVNFAFASEVDQYIKSGLRNYQIGNLKQAASDFQKVLEKDPNNPLALSNIGFIYYKMGEYDKAEEYFDKLLKVDAEDKDIRALTYYALASISKKKKDFAKYEDYLNKTLETDPEFKDAFEELFTYYKENKNYQAIVKLLENRKNLSEDKLLVLAESYIHLDEKNPNERYRQNAINLLTELKKSKNKHITKEAEKLLASLEKNKSEVKGTKDNKKVALENPEKKIAAKKISNIQGNAENITLATSENIEVLEKKQPKDVKIYNELGILYLKEGKIDKAKENLLKAIKLDPDYAESYNNLGVLYFNLKDYENAIKFFNEAIKRDPDLEKAYYNLANTYFELGKIYKNREYFTKAIQNYQKAIKLNPNNKYAYYNLANSYFYIEDYENAINNYKKALPVEDKDLENKIKQNISVAYYNLAVITTDDNQAISFLKEALSYNPSLKEANLLLGKKLYEVGKIDEAITYLEKVLTFEPNNAESIYLLGLAYAYKGNADKALSYYKTLKTISPELADKLFESIYR